MQILITPGWPLLVVISPGSEFWFFGHDVGEPYANLTRRDGLSWYYWTGRN